MCNCVENKELLSRAIRKIKGLETKNGVPYGVYSITNPKTKADNIFTVPVSIIENNKEVCCYYNSKGKKVDIKKAPKQKVTSTNKDDKKV